MTPLMVKQERHMMAIEEAIADYLVSKYEAPYENSSQQKRLHDIVIWDDVFHVADLIKQELNGYGYYFTPYVKSNAYNKICNKLFDKDFQIISTKTSLQYKTPSFKEDLLEPVRLIIEGRTFKEDDNES